MTLAIAVACLCLAALLVSVGSVECLVRRPRATLRAKFAILFIGFVVVEVSSVPAVVVTIAGEDLFALRRTGHEPWFLTTLYVLLTLYVICRLFPWREVDAMTSDPNASIASVMAEIRAAKGKSGGTH